MAVQAFLSNEETNASATPPTKLGTLDHGKMRLARFSFTASVAGDATSTVDLCRLPPGAGRIMGNKSTIWFSALGASRVMKIGLRAYTQIDGAMTAVAEDDDALATTIDVSSAGSVQLTSGTVLENDKSHKYSARDKVVVFLTITGGTIPLAATFDGYIEYMHD